MGNFPKNGKGRTSILMENYEIQRDKLKQRIMKEVRQAIRRFDWAGLNMTVNSAQRDLLIVLSKISDKKGAQGRL